MFDDSRDDIGSFNCPWYRAHTAARQYHLASLGLPLSHLSVLELGAGIGDHTEFFVRRGCWVTMTDGRPENVEVMKSRGCSRARVLDVESPGQFAGTWDVVYCYGLLYHLADPYAALKRMAAWCGELLLLETVVADLGKVVKEKLDDPTQSIREAALVPQVGGVVGVLKECFPFVYRSATHPMGMAFDVPVNWADPRGECRAVFVASRRDIVGNDMLVRQ